MATPDFHHKRDVDEYHYSSQSSGSQLTSMTRLLTAGAVGTTLVGLSGLTLAATVIALIMTTPVLVLFSPVLVPAAIVMTLIAAGFVFSGGCGVAAIAALRWLYKYATDYVTTRYRDYTFGGSYAQIGL